MKKFFVLIGLILIFTGCSFKTVTSVAQLAAPKVKPEEVLSDKQILVYDKTISLSGDLSPIKHLEFSPIDSDEVAIALAHKGYINNRESTHFAIYDIKNEELKKDIKFDVNKDRYSIDFTYSNDGKKLYINNVEEIIPYENCLRIIITEGSKRGVSKYRFECKDKNYDLTLFHKYAILDLDTKNIKHYEYSCNNLISKEYQNDSKDKYAYCMGGFIRDFDENSLITRNYSEKNGESLKDGLVLYDKDTLKAKEIITGKYDNSFIEKISKDGQYVLFREYIQRENKVKINSMLHDENRIATNFRLYDLKNRKDILTVADSSNGYKHIKFFLDEQTVLQTGSIFSSREEVGADVDIINLFTNEKKSFNCAEEGCLWGHIYPLNSRYILWMSNSKGSLYVFDTKEMKIVQKFTNERFQRPDIFISQKHKKVAFTNDNKIYIYNIKGE